MNTISNTPIRSVVALVLAASVLVGGSTAVRADEDGAAIPIEVRGQGAPAVPQCDASTCQYDEDKSMDSCERNESDSNRRADCRQRCSDRYYACRHACG